MKHPALEFDNYIHNIDELILQLESLKFEALQYMPQDEVFQKDFHSLRIVISYLKELKDEKRKRK